jgi:glycosyltransferase involved in cell wall biosynthesis
MVTTHRPFVSFLVPAFRTESYIRETIESVLAQTRPDWEMIVVDNGYSDEIAGIVEEFAADDRIRLIRQENRGVRGGVSAAARVATGRFVCVLSSDDLLQPDFCERIGALADSDQHVDAVGSDGELFYEDGHPPVGYFSSVGRTRVPLPTQSVALSDLLENGVPQPIGVIRREAWDEFDGFDPPNPDVEPDVLLWLRLAAAGRDVRILPDRLVRIRVREGSLSHDPSRIEEFENRLQGAFLAICDYSTFTREQVCNAGMMRRMRYHQALRKARSALHDGDIPRARLDAIDAYQQLATPRAAMVVLLLRLTPHTLRIAHPIKNRVQRSAVAMLHGGVR